MIRPGSSLGILGGGQLGRMLAIAAAQCGLKVHVYAPDADSPAFDVCAEWTVAPYEDEAALARFARSVEAVTYEFENVPARAAEVLGAHTLLAPNARALMITQDRLLEKTFLAGLGITTAPFAGVSDEAELASALERIGRPGILKTRRFGYDGKGQIMVREGTDPSAAWTELGRTPCILEGFVPFEREVSVVAARGRSGAFAAYDLCANEHKAHILDVTRVPAGVAGETEASALATAKTIAEALDYVGVLAVEMFYMGPQADDPLLINEIAPRVHNSGHWTLDACPVSQFENHIRAVAGWPLGSTARHSDAEMINLIGLEADAWEILAADRGALVHLYGKREAREGRKMGHVNRLRKKT
ncbi:MAG TPA: 5-(carboxyamino)imidazole ribonucleotide synthase [Solirubrobacterales bacterium]|nr:5-(carboxyamino)imidazole ribonucleotide synthase [Solirubrobacterales bacterium]